MRWQSHWPLPSMTLPCSSSRTTRSHSPHFTASRVPLRALGTGSNPRAMDSLPLEPGPPAATGEGRAVPCTRHATSRPGLLLVRPQSSGCEIHPSAGPVGKSVLDCRPLSCQAGVLRVGSTLSHPVDPPRWQGRQSSRAGHPGGWSSVGIHCPGHVGPAVLPPAPPQPGLQPLRPRSPVRRIRSTPPGGWGIQPST